VFVANHVSWLDIWLIYALRPVRFISKADVRAWPVVGWLAEKTGTLFIERERRQHTAAIIKEAEAALAQGDCIGLFPEGTTTDGLRLLPFHASLFQAAVAQQAPIVLIAIRYRLADGGVDTAPAYYGDLSLADSLRAVLARRRIRVEARYLGTLISAGKTRRELSRAAENAIATALNLPAPHTTPETPGGLRDAAPITPRPTDSPYPKPHDGSPD
jgi:1-acyl-sn-glycerol-3-phosphate acyltransferase